MKPKTAHNLARATRAAMVFGPLAIAGLNVLMHSAGAEQLHDGLVRILSQVYNQYDPAQIHVFGYDASGGLHQITDISVNQQQNGAGSNLNVSIPHFDSDPYEKYKISIGSGTPDYNTLDVTDAQLSKGAVTFDPSAKADSNFVNNFFGICAPAILIVAGAVAGISYIKERMSRR